MPVLQNLVGRPALWRSSNDRQIVPTAELADVTNNPKPLIFLAFPTVYPENQAAADSCSGRIATGEML